MIEIDLNDIINKIKKDSIEKKSQNLSSLYRSKRLDLLKENFKEKSANPWSKNKQYRYRGSIPIEAYEYALSIYGANALKYDEELFNKIFTPWLIPDKLSRRKYAK